jgi:hypothetical protein
MTAQDFTPFLGRIVDVRNMLHGLLKKLMEAGSGNGKQEAGNR